MYTLRLFVQLDMVSDLLSLGYSTWCFNPKVDCCDHIHCKISQCDYPMLSSSGGMAQCDCMARMNLPIQNTIKLLAAKSLTGMSRVHFIEKSPQTGSESPDGWLSRGFLCK